MGDPAIERLTHTWIARYLFPFGDRVTLLNEDDVITPGVELIAGAGHTPGHVAVSVESEDQSFIYLGDMILLPDQVSFPEWTTAFDSDPALLVRSRTACFSRAAHQQSLVAACHHSEVGFIEHAGNGFRWVAAN
jgi:glyoxylase-like metal-dependent hydrolase (beta-lactamase superfamily II)